VKKIVKNLAASIHQRLLNISRELKEDVNLTFSRYALERTLYRLAQSPYQDEFVLKGAMLFAIWSKEMHRPTRDLDLLGSGEDSAERLENLFKDVCRHGVEPDGLELSAESVRAEMIREDQEFQGKRIHIAGQLGNVKISIQIDIGFGDKVVPNPQEIDYPTLLDFPGPKIRAYPKEAVIAEKFQTMVTHGIANSRMKDFYDIWTLAKLFSFEGAILLDSFKATFENRPGTFSEFPIALTESFYADKIKVTQWVAFLRKNKLEKMPFDEVVLFIRDFLTPIIEAHLNPQKFNQNWVPDGPWAG
jgi:hypothetical protein